MKAGWFPRTGVKLKLYRCRVHLFGSDSGGTIRFWSHQKKKKKAWGAGVWADREAGGSLWSEGGRWTERRVISTLLHPAEALQQVFTVNKIPSGISALGQRRVDEKQITRRVEFREMKKKKCFASDYLNGDISQGFFPLPSNLQTWKGQSFRVCKAPAGGRQRAQFIRHIGINAFISLSTPKSSFMKVEGGV